VLEIPTGTVADFFGRKTSLALGCLTAGIAAAIYGSVPSFAVFLVAEVLFAVAFTLMSGADEALVYDTLEALQRSETSKRVFARLESAKLAGIVAGALSGGFIAAHFGLAAPMRLQTIPCVLAGVIAMSLLEPGDREHRRRDTSYVDMLRGGVRYFAGHKILRVLAFDMVGTAAVTWLIIWLYQPALERAGVALAFFGLVHAGLSIGQIALLNNIERVEAFVGSRKRYLLVSAIVPGVAFIVLGISTHVVVVIAAILAGGIFGLSRPPLFVSYMNKYIPSEQRATVLSTVSMLRTLAAAVVNPIAGVLSDWSIPGTMIVFGVAAVALALVTRVEEAHLID